MKIYKVTYKEQALGSSNKTNQVFIITDTIENAIKTFTDTSPAGIISIETIADYFLVGPETKLYSSQEVSNGE